MKVYKAYKFRMYPNETQKIQLNKFLGTSRFIYNYYLNKKDKLYRESKTTISLSEMKKDLVRLQNEYEWLKEIDGCILRTSLDNLDNAYNKFFKEKKGFPKYKKYNHHDTYKTVCIRGSYKGNNYQNIKVDLDKRVIKLPKIDEMPIRGYRNLVSFPYKIINATVSKEANKYYVSVCCELDVKKENNVIRNIIGLDLGVKDLVITSDGIKYDSLNKKISRVERRIKGLQKGLSRCIKGSNNSKKIIIKIQRLYQKIRNMRKYYIHHITNEIIDNNDIIVTESLHVKEMIMNKKNNLSKNLSNASLSEIIRQLQYKTKWKNKKLYQINSYYASSKICSSCDYKNEDVRDLRIRKWVCPRCGHKHDRDINASINILFEGIKMYLKENSYFKES